MNKLCRTILALLALPLLAAPLAAAEDSFAKKLGTVKVGDVKAAPAYDLPFLTWGGDVPTFMANGGDKLTQKGTIFDQQGIKVNLVNGDDFLKQVKNYLEGGTPFLRGTISQMGQASEVLGQDPRTKPVVFLQLTWSQGDHMVARPTIKTLNDLKGKTIALQWGGPHVGMLDDALKAAGLKWGDIKVVWTDNVTAVKGQEGKDPAAVFRKDPKVDACFVITPDMVDLTGGFDKIGTGAEASVKGARVVLSTVSLNRSIADVYACRKDYFDKNQAQVEKITAGYLKATEELLDMLANEKKAEKDRNKDLSKKYEDVRKMTVKVLGEEAVPDTKVAHKLILDAIFVALPGNFEFFQNPNNTVNFARRGKEAVDMAVAQGWATKRYELASADFGDYKKIKELGKLQLETGSKQKPPETEVLIDPEKVPETDLIFSFNVLFDENEMKFDGEKYRPSFIQALEQAKLFGGAAIVIRGHADVSKVLSQFVKTGKDNGTLKQVDQADGTAKYYHVSGGKETEIDLTKTKAVLDLLKTDDFKNKNLRENPQTTVEAAQKLSDDRAKNVLAELKRLADERKQPITDQQFTTSGTGVAEPVVAKPKSQQDAAKNRRVEFRVYKISPEKLGSGDFIK